MLTIDVDLVDRLKCINASELVTSLLRKHFDSENVRTMTDAELAIELKIAELQDATDLKIRELRDG